VNLAARGRTVAAIDDRGICGLVSLSYVLEPLRLGVSEVVGNSPTVSNMTRLGGLDPRACGRAGEGCRDT
jgi:hypothetical protein